MLSILIRGMIIHSILRSLFSSGRATPVMYTEIYPLERLTDGLAALERRETWGKAVVRIKDEKNAKL